MNRIASVLATLVLLLLVVIILIVGLTSLGFLDFKWPWEDVDLATEDTTVTFDPEEPEPQIVQIEPIALDCRARIHAEVPVRASREHQLIGQTYRTDTVEMVAIGDVDTCVANDQVEIAERTDGTIDVIVPAEAIEFVRPRVDAVATMDSVIYDQGLIGKFTDVFPWVSDNNGLTPAAYAFAQTVVGGSDCMREAYDLTAFVLTEAYEDQVLAQGGNPADVEVIISGAPDFTQNDLADDPKFDDFEFNVGYDDAVCEVIAGAVPLDAEEADDL